MTTTTITTFVKTKSKGSKILSEEIVTIFKTMTNYYYNNKCCLVVRIEQIEINSQDLHCCCIFFGSLCGPNKPASGQHAFNVLQKLKEKM